MSAETDVAELAARFAEKSGGSLTPEMTSELALEVVLNEIVEQACSATNATGAAIALVRGDEMVCRASNGATAPDLGARLDTSSGLTGECCRTRQTQRCADALADARVDIEASARLGVRSVIVMPLLRPNGLVGVFELLSCWPSAFSEREERSMEELARRAIRSLDSAEQAMRPRPEKKKADRADAFPADELALARKIAESQRAELVIEQATKAHPAPTEPVNRQPEKVEPANREPENRQPDNLQPESRHPENKPGDNEAGGEGRRGGFDFLSFALGAAVLAATVLLAFTVGRKLEAGRTPARTHRAAVVQAAPEGAQPTAPGAEMSVANSQDAPTQTAPPPSATVVPSANVPAGGLVVYEGSKEVFRMPPNRAGGAKSAVQNSSSSSASASVLSLSPAEAETRVQSRVEPQYPEDARQKKIQGAVVLAIRVGVDGSVEDLQYVSGPPQLAEAAVNAVKRWRFKPQTINGSPAEMQTRVTLDFRLPG